MNQRTICDRLKIVPVILSLLLTGVAQERPNTAVKQELALSVDNGADRPWEIPAFKGGGGEATNFRRLESWKASAETTVNAIVFKIGREADIVIAHLSVRLENDKEVIVGTYRLGEGQTIKAEELTKFGLQPLVLKVVKAKPLVNSPLPAIMPKVDNKTKSIEVVSLYQAAPPLDGSFQLSLRNVSTKAIVGLDLFIPSSDGNGGEGLRSQGGGKEEPVMLPGGTSVHHIGISRGGRMTPDGYVPDVAVQQTLIIRTVVFEDGTYDGLVEPAAEMEAQRRGLNIQRRRILSLLQKLTETNDDDVPATLDQLKEQAYALSKTADPSVSLELIALFPALDKMSESWLPQRIENGLRDGKLEFLRHINDFEEMEKQRGHQMTFAEWFKQTIANYEKLASAL